MSIISPSTILLLLIMGLVWLVTSPLTRRVKDIERGLTADELKTFNDTYLRASDRNTVPMKFGELLDLKKRLSLIWILSVLAIVFVLIAVIFLGPDLGLTGGAGP